MAGIGQLTLTEKQALFISAIIAMFPVIFEKNNFKQGGKDNGYFPDCLSGFGFWAIHCL